MLRVTIPIGGSGCASGSAPGASRTTRSRLARWSILARRQPVGAVTAARIATRAERRRAARSAACRLGRRAMAVEGAPVLYHGVRGPAAGVAAAESAATVARHHGAQFPHVALAANDACYADRRRKWGARSQGHWARSDPAEMAGLPRVCRRRAGLRSGSGAASSPSRRIAGGVLVLAERTVDLVKERGDARALLALEFLGDG